MLLSLSSNQNSTSNKEIRMKPYLQYVFCLLPFNLKGSVRKLLGSISDSSTFRDEFTWIPSFCSSSTAPHQQPTQWLSTCGWESKPKLCLLAFLQALLTAVALVTNHGRCVNKSVIPGSPRLLSSLHRCCCWPAHLCHLRGLVSAPMLTFTSSSYWNLRLLTMMSSIPRRSPNFFSKMV